MSIKNDACEFGRHFKQGGWRLGLLVARNVAPRKPGQPKADGGENSPENGKVSISEFARLAGVSKSHVLYYYRAWQLAAKADECQLAEQLLPGDEDGCRRRLKTDHVSTPEF
jgi:hypothetical protein